VAERGSAGELDFGPVPTFLYDFNSPYAHLAAARVDDVLPVAP
jgi:hypothetical protein